MRKSIALLFILLFSFAFAQAQQDSSLNEYKGIYKFKEGSSVPSVEITIQDGELYATATIGSAVLSKVAKDTFSIHERNGLIYFSRNTEGKVVFIHVEVGELVLEGAKEGSALAFVDPKRSFALRRQ